MRYFKLKALSCSGKGNRVLRKGDNEVLQEGAFHNADKMVSDGYIVEVNKDGNPLGSVLEVVESDEPTGVLDALAESIGGDGFKAVNPIEGKKVGDFKKAELQELCGDVEIVFEDDDTKAILFAELEKHYC